MSPVHIAPACTIRIVLVEEVVLAIVIHHTIGVIHPAISRGKVETRTIGLVIGIVKGIGRFYLADTYILFGSLSEDKVYFFTFVSLY